MVTRWLCTLAGPRSLRTVSGSIRLFFRSGSVLFFAAVLTLGGLGLRFGLDQRAFRLATDGTQRIRRVIDATDQILSLLKDAETGQRGYLLNGIVDDLEPYANSQRAVLYSLARLDRALVPHSPTEAQVALLNLLVAQKLEVMRRSIYLYDTVGPQAAYALVRTDHGRQLMNQIRLVCGELKDLELGQLESSERVLQQSISASRIFVSSGGGVLVSLLLVASVVVRQEIRRQERLIEQREHTNILLQMANEKLHRANEDLEQFAYISAHDLQEPLRTIIVFTQLLEKGFAHHVDKQVVLYMHNIVSSGHRMSALVAGALKYAELSIGNPDLQLVDVEEIFSEVVQGCGAVIQETDASVTHDPLPSVRAQSAQVAMLLQNLITNGLKYRIQGQPPQIHVHAEARGDEWLFSVEDKGIGFDMKYSQQIFGLFKRLNREIPGTGLGLAVCKRIVENHGGRIWATSKLGEGSTFWFMLTPENTL